MSIIFIFASCSKAGDPYGGATPPVTTVPTPPAPPTPPASSLKTFLALGDSYTIGQSVTSAGRFPSQTVSILNTQSSIVGSPGYVATTGWTTGNLITALNTTPPSTNFDIVTLLIGVNNQFQGRPLSEYRLEFSALLNRAIQYAGNKKEHVFVLSIPDYSVTPFASGLDKAKIAMEIDLFNAANKEITLAAGVKYLDITPISREGAVDAAMQASDGLHPSEKQYGRWAALLAPMIQAAF